MHNDLSFLCVAPVSHFSVLGCKIYTQERREQNGGEGGLSSYQAICLALFALLISYSLILAYHRITQSFLHKQCSNFDAF